VDIREVLSAYKTVYANVLEKYTISFFSPEDGDSMFLQNLPISLHSAKTHKKIIILTAVKT
jgi:hypothetical protein